MIVDYIGLHCNELKYWVVSTHRHHISIKGVLLLGNGPSGLHVRQIDYVDTTVYFPSVNTSDIVLYYILTCCE